MAGGFRTKPRKSPADSGLALAIIPALQPSPLNMKTPLLCALLTVSFAAFAQDDHQAMVNAHGDHVMGFSHEKTTHHFELNYDGGVIDVRANDVPDTESRDQIRSHFGHIAQMFAAGNFNAPMLVHVVAVPGTATMTRLKDQLHWNLEE